MCRVLYVRGIQIRVGDKVRIARDYRDLPASKRVDGQDAVFQGLRSLRTGDLYREPCDGDLPLTLEFKLADGSSISGWECFWVPLPVALETEVQERDEKG